MHPNVFHAGVPPTTVAAAHGLPLTFESGPHEVGPLQHRRRSELRDLIIGAHTDGSPGCNAKGVSYTGRN